MMIKRTLFSVVMLSSMAYADSSNEQIKPPQKSSFYLKVGSGASFANTAEISAPPSVWDPAEQGYNSTLGTAPIFLGGLGYDSPFVSTDITTSYRPNYTYRKYQIPTTTTTPGTLGTTTRQFDLDVTSILWNFSLNGRGFQYLNWNAGKGFSIFPVIGGGVGVSQMKVFNFRSTGLPPVADGFPAFASENQYMVKYEFTYQLIGGFEFRYKDLCSFSLGYRWFDVSSFHGPRYLRDSEGNAIDVGSDSWKVKFAANEAFIEFKVFL